MRVWSLSEDARQRDRDETRSAPCGGLPRFVSLRSLNGRGALRSHSGRGLLTRQLIEVVVVDTGTA